MGIGARIRRFRDTQGLSLRALAREAGVSVGYLSKLEQNVSSPTVEMLEKIADALKVGVSELLESSEAVAAEPELPVSLKEFLDRYSDVHCELKDPDWVRALGNVRFRGKYPEASDDWLAIYLNLKRAIKH